MEPRRPLIELKVGTFRRALLFGPWALKVPRWSKCPEGRWCNRREARISATAGDGRFCPVLRVSPRGWWLLMRRAIPLARAPISRAEIIGQVQELMSLQAATGVRVEDIKTENLGTLDGALVVFDYAGLPPSTQRELRKIEGGLRKGE